MSELYNRINLLCQNKNVTITDMCRLSGASRGSLTDLKMGRINTLKAETMKKIADYFEVSVDYLLTGEDQKEKPTANDGNRLSVEQRVEQILDGMANEHSGTLMLDGKPASPEALDALRQAIKMGVEYARKINNDKK